MSNKGGWRIKVFKISKFLSNPSMRYISIFFNAFTLISHVFKFIIM